MWWTTFATMAGAVPLDLDLDRPVARGDLVTAVVTGSAPGDTVYLAYSSTTGVGPNPYGQRLDLVAPRLLGQAVADASHVAVIQFLVPAHAPLVLRYLQAFDGGALAEKSDVLAAQTYADVRLTGDADATVDLGYQETWFGWSLAMVGDTDGDGFDDVAVGLPHGAAGKAALYTTPFVGLVTGAVDHARYEGIVYGDEAGFSLAAAGDPDDDGVPDLLIGAFGGVGEAFLVSGAGPAGISRLDLAAARLGAGGGGAGVAVAGPGDVSGDGVDDVLLGAPVNLAGEVLVYDGPLAGARDAASADAHLVGETVNDIAGISTCGTDVDGDGVGDVIVGAAGSSRGAQYGGVAYVLRGPVAGSVSLASAATIYEGATVSGAFGQVVIPAGDLDGDGLEDLVVSGPSALLGDGEVDVFTDAAVPGVRRGSTATARFSGEASSSSYAGSALAAGDLDADGFPDLVIGAPNAVPTGQAYVVFGPFAGVHALGRADLVLTGPPGAAFAEVGHAVAVGDVDHDGLPDVLVGAPWSPPNGKVYVFSNPSL